MGLQGRFFLLQRLHLTKFGTGYQSMHNPSDYTENDSRMPPSSKDNLNVRAGQIWIQGRC